MRDEWDEMYELDGWLMGQGAWVPGDGCKDALGAKAVGRCSSM